MQVPAIDEGLCRKHTQRTDMIQISPGCAAGDKPTAHPGKGAKDSEKTARGGIGENERQRERKTETETETKRKDKEKRTGREERKRGQITTLPLGPDIRRYHTIDDNDER